MSHPADLAAAAPHGVNRRQFLAAAAVATAAVSLPVLQPAASAAGPKQKPTPPDKPVDVGPLSDFAKDGVTDKWAKSDASFFVVRHDGKLFAPSSLCTHRFCTLQVETDNLYCKCHKSHFTQAGEVIDGPAKRSLPRYKITVNDKQHVIVEPKTEYTEKQWDDAASFVKVT